MNKSNHTTQQPHAHQDASPRPQRRIAITGGIGSGKSHVGQLLKERGISIFDCDTVAKDIIAHDAAIRAQLAHLIGGEPTRQRLGDYLRAGNGNNLRVNAIVHPRVALAFEQSGMQWMECAILFESGFDRLVDDIVVVTCPTAERIRRIILRDHCDADTARRWMALQLTDEERLRHAEAATAPTETRPHTAATATRPHTAARRLFHIVNDGTTPLEPQLDTLLHQL